MQQRSKEQEEALTKETLVILSEMRIRFPGKTNEEAEIILDDVSIGEGRPFIWNVWLQGIQVRGLWTIGKYQKTTTHNL